MATIFVSKAGNDSNAGTSQGSPKLTVAAATLAATNNSDIVEIIDEGTYAESQILIKANDVTLTHTASAVGRPVIDASGLGSTQPISLKSGGTRTGFTHNGIEIKGSGNDSQELYAMNNNTSNAVGLTITDCFIYEVAAVADQFLQATSGDKALIKQSSFMFVAANRDAFALAGGCEFEIENCFLSRSSGGSDRPIIAGLSSQTASTASFCTFVQTAGSGIDIIDQFGKVINCVVTGSGNVNGIDALDHTFNVVNVVGTAFKNGSNSSASAGTGETEAAVTFVDGTSAGNTEAVINNFALAEGSVGIDQGTAFNSINIDILGVSRPQGTAFDMGAFERLEPYFQVVDNSQVFNTKFGGSFEIRGTTNRLRTRRFPSLVENRQAPFLISIPGPATIRERSGSYKAET